MSGFRALKIILRLGRQPSPPLLFRCPGILTHKPNKKLVVYLQCIHKNRPFYVTELSQYLNMEKYNFLDKYVLIPFVNILLQV